MPPGVVLMPCYVNIGARVGAGTMVDTWATVGSCAQIGTDVHLSGGVGIGGVLERSGRARDRRGRRLRRLARRRRRGMHVGREAVLGAGVVLTASTAILDVSGPRPSSIAAGAAASVVIPGTRTKKFPAGAYRVPCALIIGERSASPTARPH